jgi:branched-subunit amino acid aminotransferase/4-amino-4-deoxychorismate lyase
MWEVGKAANIPVAEATMFDDDLYAADEVFLTGTTRGVMPIVEVEDRKIASGMPGPVTKTLVETFRRMARDSVQGSIPLNG